MLIVSMEGQRRDTFLGLMCKGAMEVSSFRPRHFTYLVKYSIDLRALIFRFLVETLSTHWRVSTVSVIFVGILSVLGQDPKTYMNPKPEPSYESSTSQTPYHPLIYSRW